MYNKEIQIRGTNNGYYYFIDYSHPLATGNSGRVYLHRHIASLMSNRWLSKEDNVHHIDENKLNNSEDNLVVLNSAEHAHIHKGTLEHKLCELCKKEFIPNKISDKYCSTTCYGLAQIKNSSLSKELLDSLIPTMSWVALGKLFGYTDSGIRKRAKVLGCNIPVRKQVRVKC